MNLENLNLVELNAQEVQEVDGGSISVIYINWRAVGNFYKDAGLATLGFLAGIGDGIRDGMK